MFNLDKYVINGIGLGSISKMIKAFNIQNLKHIQEQDNPYKTDTLQAGYATPDATRPSKLNPKNGVPVFVDITLHGGTYTDNITGKPVTFPDITIDAIICTVTKVKKIVKTEIQGRDGTVKEYIGADDSQVDFQGVICGANGVYPQSEVSALNRWIDAPVTKKVSSMYLQNLGINNIVVTNASIPQIAGGYSYQTFTINCISDLPVELIIK